MSKLSFRDRFFTPPVARAVLSPWSILLLGAATAGGIVAGLPIVVAGVVGVAAYGAKVLISVPKNKTGSRIDPFVLSEPWRGYVQGAQSAKLRFDRTVAGTRDGPIKDRLGELSKRLQDGIEESWRIASRGDDIDAATAQLNTRQAQAELDQLRSQPTDRPDLASTIKSLEAQISSGLRMENVSATARDRLRLLDARFDELVARAVEVSVGAADGGVLGNDVDDLVTELEGLRLAMDDTRRAESGDLQPPTTGTTDNTGTASGIDDAAPELAAPGLAPPAPDVDSSERKPQTRPPQ